MISIVARLKVKEGQEKDFEALALELTAAVNEHEEGCMYYALHRSDDPQTYVIIERYRDQAAIDAHRQTDHYKSIGARMGPHMAGRPELEILQEI